MKHYNPQVFAWRISNGSSRTVDEAPPLSSVFGDGYEQVARNGINAEFTVWSVTFTNRHYTEIREIELWLRDRGLHTPFMFVPEETGIPVQVRRTAPIEIRMDGNIPQTLSTQFKEWKGT